MLHPDKVGLTSSQDWSLFHQVRDIFTQALDTVAEDPSRRGTGKIVLPHRYEGSFLLSRQRRLSQGVANPGEQLALYCRLNLGSTVTSGITYWRVEPDEDHSNSRVALRKAVDFLEQQQAYYKNPEALQDWKTRWHVIIKGYEPFGSNVNALSPGY